MPRCRSCPRSRTCRVPGELDRFNSVVHRLEEEERAPLLRQRLHYFMDHQDCLVEAGYASLV